MSNVLKMLSRGGAAAAETDPNFKQTVLLLHGDGTNGAQNNTFLDSSSNNFTITRNPATGPNAPTQGTFSPFSVGAGEFSNFFAGTNGFLTTATNADFTFGTGDFTVEFWCYPISSTGPGGYAYLYAQGPNTTASLGIYFESGTFRVWNGSAVITGTVSRATNTWYHVAVSRSGTSMKLFVNGVQDGSTATNSSNITTGSTYGATLGRWVEISDANYFVGYLASVRVVKGRAVYTSNFTPSTTPLGATSGGTNPPQGTETSLLTCQSNRFVDNGGLATPNTITRNGDVRVTPFSPFAPSAAYSASTNGGSGYFDGSGDILETPTSGQFAPTGDFTIGLWFYPNSALTTNQNILGNLTANVGTDWLIQMVSGTINFYTNGTTVRISSATAIVPFQWNYISMTRSSNVISAHVNGASLGTYSQSGTFGSATKKLQIGNATNNINGYVSGVILVDGSANTSVPTAPPTAISGTNLLLNFTNAGIFDNTGKNNLETVGNAQIDTTTKKYGTGSMEFDGSGDYLFIRPTENFSFGTGNFTIEFWWNPSTLATAQVLLYNTNDVGVIGTGEFVVVYNTSVGLRFYINQNQVDIIQNATTGWSTGQWYHVAAVRNGNTLTLYRNGTSIASGSVSGVTIGSQSVPCYIGGQPFDPLYSTGFIDDLRITKGVARYPTEPFPTKAFPDQ